MAGKGAEAKSKVANKIAASFGDKYVATDGSKIYVMSEENGVAMQVCLSMTIPKTPYGAPTSRYDMPAGGYKFSADAESGDEMPPWEVPQTAPPASEISAEDKAKIDELYASLGLV